MSIIESIREKAASHKKRIVLPRSSDERVIKAAQFLQDEELADVILLRNKDSKVETQNIEVLDPETDEKLQEFAEAFYQKRNYRRTSFRDSQRSIVFWSFFGFSGIC